MDIKEGMRVFYVKTEKKEIKEKEWLTIKSVKKNDEDWGVLYTIELSNGETLYVHMANITEHRAVSESVGTCYFLIEEGVNPIFQINNFFEKKKEELREQINTIRRYVVDYSELQEIIRTTLL